MHCVSYTHWSNPFNAFPNAFRMPLYFFLSGLFFKTYNSFKGFTIRKINKLLIPFFFFYLIGTIILPNVLSLVGYQVRNDDILGIRSVYAFLLPSVRVFPNGPIWFLLCLFVINMLFYPLYLFSKVCGNYKVVILAVASFMMGLLGWWLGQIHIQLPFFADTALTCMPFYCAGYLFNKHTNILYPNKYDKYNWIAIIVLVAVTQFFIVPSRYPWNEFGNPIFLYISGLSGTLMIMLTAKYIKKLPCVSYWGRYSIMILCTHQMVIQAYLIFLKKLNITEGFLTMLLLLLTIFTYNLIIPLFKKYLPYVTAQKDVLKIS